MAGCCACAKSKWYLVAQIIIQRSTLSAFVPCKDLVMQIVLYNITRAHRSFNTKNISRTNVLVGIWNVSKNCVRASHLARMTEDGVHCCHSVIIIIILFQPQTRCQAVVQYIICIYIYICWFSRMTHDDNSMQRVQCFFFFFFFCYFCEHRRWHAIRCMTSGLLFVIYHSYTHTHNIYIWWIM